MELILPVQSTKKTNKTAKMEADVITVNFFGALDNRHRHKTLS